MTEPSAAARRGRFASAYWVRGLLVVVYLIWVAHFYVPGAGFTRLIMFPVDDSWETPLMQRTPHVHDAPSGGYDGQYYAHLALDPLVRDPATDRAMDKPAYRARRILCSWIAWLAGLGQPFWVLQAYALENVAAWLLLAWWLHRRLPGRDARALATWAACLFCHGLLISTRLALVDGPGALIVAMAVSSVERGRTFRASALLGAAGLARETNVLALLVLPAPWPPSGRRLLGWLGRLALAIAPLVLWLDYLRSVYRSGVASAAGGLSLRLADMARYCRLTLSDIAAHGLHTPAWAAAAAIVAIVVQALFLVTRIRWKNPWWRLGIGYVALLLMLDTSVWEGQPGAFTRVLLPMQLAFNLLVVESPRFWWVFPMGNLTLLASLSLLSAH